ncbi:MAG: hypothetical protein COW03_17395 [Cytophagales bacterium CG12_big_fil_rev_8_21_14_0_65_40_12]|nr:MAG: hypothetical protein COW03_17395 [Cytophagales bacterium CG12_big_fil_rev_8_21_14_0_65_40_12]PIW02981.1 MAG: hypothetical protein COW40_16660 [Cytophagales bacterium CG17_big_fil_post_rev_8_21_14_2_50_40_13]
MKKIFLIALAVLVVGGLGTYVYMGGLNSVEVTVVDVDGYNVAGKLFQGKSDAKEIKDYFFEAKELTQSQELPGILTIMHYNDTTLAKGETKLFIGVMLATEDFTLPEDYQLISIQSKKAIRARIEAHNWVIPGAATIEERISQKAKEEGLSTELFTIEKYVSTNILEIDSPIKSN